MNQSKKIAEKLKVRKLDCFPVLWVQSVPSKTEWAVKFTQRITSKYLVIKLIDSHKNNVNDNNIDMYNLTLNGYTLAIPSSSSN